MAELTRANLGDLILLASAIMLGGRMIFTARLLDAKEAQAIGLVSEVVADEANLLARATELADTLRRDYSEDDVRRIVRAVGGTGFNLNLFPNLFPNRKRKSRPPKVGI